MPHSGGKLVTALLELSQGRLSLQLVIAASIVLFWIAFVLFCFAVLFRAYQNLRSRYRAARRRLYAPAIEKVLMEEPLEEVIAVLRPRRWGDASVVQEVMLESMRHLKGPPFDTLRAAAAHLGFVERNLRRLRSRSKLRRGMAMEALGIMRAPQAVVGIIDILGREPMDMKLVALSALAAIGEPASLPYFVKAADRLSPAMLPRLASLMLEFGPPARPAIKEIIERHRRSFPPRVLREFLQEIAPDASLESLT